jgi:SepF-like predicted cell division protein (DUF552 family)
MEELQNTINDLQARLAIVGGGRIIITSDHVSIRLGKEHEYFEVHEQNNFDSPTEPDVEMFKTMYNY